MKRIAMFVATAVLAVGCSRDPGLVILHVNDTHSHLEPERSGTMAGTGGAIERAAFVDSVRAAEGDSRVLLLHAGDFNQGSSYFTQLGGDVEVDVVNAMGYDCVTLGNHEFDNNVEDLCRRVKMLNCPVVCANLDLRSFELGEYVKPFAVIEKAGMKIGIIGITSDISKNVAKAVSSRIPQLDNVEVVNRCSSELHAMDCDLVILLSHIGYEEDIALVPQIRGIDLVIGGHSHTRVKDFVYVRDLDRKKTPITTDWCFGREVGKISVW